MARRRKSPDDDEAPARGDPLMVRSVEKAFRVLNAFEPGRDSMSLTQIAAATALDKSGAQRFTHTLVKLGYLAKSADDKRYELTPKTLSLGYQYSRASPLVGRATPYLMHLSKTTEEAVSLTVLDDRDVVFVMRFLSQHMLSTDVIVGTRLPAYCTAPGLAILSMLPPADALSILKRSDRRAITPHTTWQLPELQNRLAAARSAGYAMAVEEIYPGDISIAAPILAANGTPAGAVSIGVSRIRFEPGVAAERFAPLAIAAARSMSQSAPIGNHIP